MKEHITLVELKEATIKDIRQQNTKLKLGIYAEREKRKCQINYTSSKLKFLPMKQFGLRFTQMTPKINHSLNIYREDHENEVNNH